MTAVTQQYITSDTPLGVNLIGNGATFRVWAPRAEAVYINGNFNSSDNWMNGGSIIANGMPMHNLPSSAQINIPANSILVFAFDL